MTDKSFQHILKQIHRAQDKIAPLIEGLEDDIPQQSMKDYFVKLQILIKQDEDNKHGNYETISGEKKEVELASIFDKLTENGSEPTKLLVLGGAGVGKTTLMQYIAYKWGAEELWQDKFDYVYRVSLKTLLNDHWKDDYSKEELREDILKCLVHYNLVMRLNDGIDEPSLKDVHWSADTEKTLLLLDGYDEIAHLKNSNPPNKDYQRLEKKIFEHKNLIFTSRPNAIGKTMKSQFDKVLENTGLSQSGIEHYFSLYFRDDKKGKEAELRSFLAGNQVIRQICTIPVNIAMLCYIWSTSKSSTDMRQISTVSSLYNNVIDRLGKRHFAKEWSDQDKADKVTLEEALKNGKFTMDEVKVLTHVAYKALTGGGINVAENDKVETLIIKGATDKDGEIDPEDQDGISVLSSINYLSNQKVIQDDQKRKVTVGKVCRYGLLKVEGTVTSINNKKSDTDAQRLSYSFIHLTFQEYLTAYYLKEQLTSDHVSEKEKRDICQYLAEHRNEPRYLMMLKFMAGILSADQSAKAEYGIKVFWDAIICNVDGAIELGIETKVSLIIHLLAQSKINGKIDSRVPHQDQMILLVDAIVLNDLFGWSTQLKESDFMTDTMKEAVLHALMDGNLTWSNKKLTEICAKASSPLQVAMTKMTENQKGKDQIEEYKGATTVLAIRMVNEVNLKLTSDERRNLVDRLKSIIRDHEKQSWQLLSKTLEELRKRIPESPLSDQESVNLIKSLAEMILNPNLTVLETIFELIKISGKKSILEAIEKINDIVNKQFLAINGRAQFYNRTDLCSHIIELIGVAKDKSLIDTGLETIINNMAICQKTVDAAPRKEKQNYDLEYSAIIPFARLLAVVDDKDLLTKILGIIFDLAKKTDYQGAIKIKTISKIVSKLNDREMITASMEQIIPLLSIKESNNTRVCALETLISLARVSNDKTIQLKILKAADNFIDNTNNTDDDGDLKTGGLVAFGEILVMIGDLELAKKETQKISKVIDSIPSSMHSTRNEILLAHGIEKVVDKYQDKALAAKLMEYIMASNCLYMNCVLKLAIIVKDEKHVMAKFMEDVDRSLLLGNYSVLPFLANLLEALTDKDKDQADKIAKYILSLYDHDNKGVQTHIIMETPKLVSISALKTVVPQITDKIVTLLAGTDSGLAYQVLTAVSSGIMNKTLETKLIEVGVRLLDNTCNEVEVICRGIKILCHVTKLTDDKEKVILITEKLVKLLDAEDKQIKNAAIVGIDQMIGSVSNDELTVKMTKQYDIFSLLEIPGPIPNIIKATTKMFIKTNDRESIAQIVAKLVNLLESGFPQAYLVGDIVAIFEITKDTELAEKAIESLIKIIPYNQHLMLQSKYWQNEWDASSSIFNIIRSIGDKNLAAKIIGKVTHFSDDAKINRCWSLAYLGYDMLKLADNEELTQKVFEELSKVFSDIIIHGEQKRNFEEIIGNFLIPMERILKYLQTSNTSTRSRIATPFYTYFGRFFEKISLMDELLRDPQNLTVEIINERLFEKKLENTILTKIKETLALLKSDHGQDSSLEKLRDILMLHLNKIGELKKHELVMPALAIVGLTEGEGPWKEYPELADKARKMLDFQIKHLDHQGIEWINKNLDRLVALASESKSFIRKLYHKLLEDEEITRLEEELMIKFINYGLTTSITRNRAIIFEGKTYKIKSQHTTQLLDAIATAVIKQERDMLALQYKTHKPIFPKSSEFGMKQASADVEQIYSVIDKTQELSSDQWIITELRGETEEGTLLLLEKRSPIGDHLLYQLSHVGHREMRIDIEDPMKELEEIFGRYEAGKKLQGRSTSMAVNIGDQILRNDVQDVKKLLEGKAAKEYFQQELLGLGSTDRIDSIDKELSTKLTDYEKVLVNKLTDKVSAENQSKIKEYFRAFVETFASAYTAAQVIDSGQVQLNSSSLQTKVLATLVSFAPFAGDGLSKAVNSVGEFTKSREMIINARTIKKLASDGTSLSQLVSETAMKIVLNKSKQNDIVKITDEDLEKTSGKMMEKISKFITNLNVKIDEFIYTKKFSTSAAKLGNNDANRLIEHWISQKVHSEDKSTIQNHFVELATEGTVAAEPTSPGKEATARPGETACCSMF